MVAKNVKIILGYINRNEKSSKKKGNIQIKPRMLCLVFDVLLS